MRDRLVVTPEVRRRLGERARDLRRAATRSEQMLWAGLRGGRLGVRFRRQQVIGPFIVDFVCAQHNLIIEIDGPIHQDQPERDAERQQLLEACGYRVLRFDAHAVETALPSVIAAIAQHCHA